MTNENEDIGELGMHCFFRRIRVGAKYMRLMKPHLRQYLNRTPTMSLANHLTICYDFTVHHLAVGARALQRTGDVPIRFRIASGDGLSAYYANGLRALSSVMECCSACPLEGLIALWPPGCSPVVV